MSSATLDASETVTSLKVTQLRVLASEWTKFRSVRSTLYTLVTSFVLTIGFSALLSALTASQYDNFNAGQREIFNASSTSLAGTLFAQLAVGVLGVLLITGEYSTGMIRASLTVVPRRLPMLWAKLAVFAAVAFVVSLVASFAAFFLGQALLASNDLNVSITSDGALRSVVGAAAYVTLAGLIGLTLGAILRNTAAAITTFVAVIFVLPPLTQLLPSSLTEHFVQYLPSSAGRSIYGGGGPELPNALSPGAGLIVLVAYVVVLIAAAAWRLKRSDA